MRWFAALCLSLLLGACSTPPKPVVDIDGLFDDTAFAAPARPVDVAEVMRLTPQMKRYITSDIEPRIRSHNVQHALLDALYSKGALKLDYDSAQTRNAAEAFEARAGNCLSLVIMTAAFAKEMGLAVRFQNVLVDQAWERSDDLYFFIGHVNLVLGAPLMSMRWSASAPDALVVDFLPGQDLRRQRATPIDERRVLSMYMNNKAAEALAGAKVDEAYWWAREAVRLDRDFLAAHNTLGVVYMRKGLLPQAERALRSALAVEPRNPHVLGNLAGAIDRQGRRDEAAALRAELARLQPVQPFAAFNAGLKAAREGDWRRARGLFEDELARGADTHEVHFWLAVAHVNLGEMRQARRHLSIAVENSTTRDQQRLYGAKLDRLKAAGL
jgi:Flp pilus assembly protein TadD